jgi:hypothetical protein
MKKPTISLVAAVLLGLGMVAGSFYWTSPLGPQPQWSEEQALERQQAGANYHSKKLHPLHASGHEGHASENESESDEVRLARQQWEQQDARLQAVQSGYRRIANTLWWSGIVVAGLGILGLILTRPNSA